MAVNERNNQQDKETRLWSKRFPTLVTGGVVLMASVALLGGKVLLSNVEAKAKTQVQTVAGSEDQTDVEETQEVAVQSEVKDGVQYITSSMDQYSYEPITVVQGIPVKWTIQVPQGALNSCNNSIIIPKYDKEIELKPGENVIEFTPDESGVFPFSCWMGMVQSDITVVGEDGTVADNPDDGTSGYAGGRGAMGGCCGGL